MNHPDAHRHATLGARFAALEGRARTVAEHVEQRRPISRDVARDFEDAPSSGQRAADAVAKFGGSWTFVGLFGAVLVVWVGANVLLVRDQGSAFDPYPFILLNLVLSMLAAVQAPIILMSQNRQSEKDRAASAHDYEVNLKAELEIMLLHEKIDLLREKQWLDLLNVQQQQLTLLATLCAAQGVGIPHETAGPSAP